MIEGGWNFVWAAYAIALGALGVLTVSVLARLSNWSRRARELDRAR